MSLPGIFKKSATPLSQFRSKDKLSSIVANKPIPINPASQSGIQVEQEQMTQTTSYARDGVFSTRIGTRQWKQTNQLMHDRQQMDINLTDKQENLNTSLYIDQQPETRLNKLRSFIDDILQQDEDDLLFGALENEKPIIDKQELNVNTIGLYNDNNGLTDEDLKIVQQDNATLKSLLDEKNLSELELFNVCFDECQAFMREHKGNEAVLTTLGTIKNYYVSKIIGRNARESSFDGALKVLDNRCQVLEAENLKLFAKCQELEQQVLEKTQLYEKTRKQVFQHVKDREDLLGTINSLQNKNQSAEKALENFKASAAQAMAENVVMRKRIERLSEARKANLKEVESLREMIENQRREIAFLAPAKAALQEELLETQKELKETKSQLDEYQQRFFEVKDFLDKNCITQEEINAGMLGKHIAACFGVIIQLQQCQNDEETKYVLESLSNIPERLQSFVKTLSTLRNATTTGKIAAWLKGQKQIDIEENSKGTMPDAAILVASMEVHKPRVVSKNEQQRIDPAAAALLAAGNNVKLKTPPQNKPEEPLTRQDTTAIEMMKQQEKIVQAEDKIQELTVEIERLKNRNKTLLEEIDNLRQQLLMANSREKQTQEIVEEQPVPEKPTKRPPRQNQNYGYKGISPGIPRSIESVAELLREGDETAKAVAEILRHIPQDDRNELGSALVGALFRHPNRLTNREEFKTTYQAYKDLLSQKLPPDQLAKVTKSLVNEFIQACNDLSPDSKITMQTYKRDRIVYDMLKAIFGSQGLDKSLHRSQSDTKLISDSNQTRKLINNYVRRRSAGCYDKAPGKRLTYAEQQMRLQRRQEDIARELRRSKRELETKLAAAKGAFLEELQRQVKDPAVLAVLKNLIGKEMDEANKKLNEEICDLQKRLARAVAEIEVLSTSAASSRAASMAAARTERSVGNQAGNTAPKATVSTVDVETQVIPPELSLEELRRLYECRLAQQKKGKKERPPSESAQEPEIDEFEQNQPEMTNEQLQQASKDMVQFFAAMGRAGVQDKLLPDVNLSEQIKESILRMIEKRKSLITLQINRSTYKNKGINSIFNQPKSQYSSRNPSRMMFEGYQLLNTNITIVNNQIVQSQFSQSELNDVVASSQVLKQSKPLIQIQNKDTQSEQKVFTSILDMHPYAGESVFTSDIIQGPLPVYAIQCFQLTSHLEQVCTKYKKVDEKIFPALLSTATITEKNNQQLQECFSQEIKGEEVSNWVPGYNVLDNNFMFIRLDALSIRSNKHLQAFKIFGMKPKFMDIGSQCYYKIPLEHCMLKSEKWVIKAIIELVTARIDAKFSYYVKTPQSLTSFTEISHAYDRKHYESFSLFAEKYLVRKYGTPRLGMSLYVTLLANLAYYQYQNDQIYIFLRILFEDVPLDATLLYFQIYQCVKGATHIKTDLITNLISAIFKTWTPKKQFSYLQQILTKLYDYKHNQLPEIVNISDIAINFMQQMCLSRRIAWAQLQNLCDHMLKQDNTIDITKKTFKQIISNYLPTYPQESIEELFYAYSTDHESNISRAEIYAIFCTHQLCRFGSIPPEVLQQILSPADLELQKGITNMLKYIRPLTQHFEELLQRRGDSSRGNALDAYVVASKEDLKAGDATGATVTLLQAMQVILSVSAELEPSVALKAMGNVSAILKKAFL